MRATATARRSLPAPSALSALVALVLSMAFHHITIWFYIPVTAVLLFPFIRLFKVFPHLKLAFLHRKRVEEAVRERAVYAFFQKGVHKTDEQTGILIFISLLERKVWVLADKGIHGKIADDFLRTLAGELAAGIREDRAFDALCGVVRKCGAELARHFPGSHGKDTGDEIICEERPG